MQAYNPRDQDWSVEAPLTSARHKSCAVAMDGDAVVLTGGTGLGVGKVNQYTPETVYRVAICPGGNLPYIRNYPINNTVFKNIYPVGSWIYLPYK